MLRRLLGEIGLERKLQLLFGGGILVLIAGTLYWYSRRMENEIFRATEERGHLLADRIFLQEHWQDLEAKDTVKEIVDALSPQLSAAEETIHSWRLINPKGEITGGQLPKDSETDEFRPPNRFERRALASMRDSDRVHKADVVPGKPNLFQYARAVRIREPCLACHPTEKVGTFKGVMSVTFDIEKTREAIFWNWAILVSAGLIITVVAMIGSYLIVRFVIIGPIRHLRKVSVEVTRGNLEVRADIHTGDEFESLGLTFNRMLRHTQAAQEELRRVNETLDQKFDELAQANMALFEMNRLKTEFLSTISHELRTPLNSILGFSDVLLEGSFGELTERQRRYVDNIRSSGSQLLTMINDVLDLSKIESGQMEVNVSEFSFRDLCEGLLGMHRELAAKKQLTLESDLSLDIPIVRTDRLKFQRILENLVSNAVKFTPEGGRIELAARAEGELLVVEVTDTGVGISEEDRKIIFEKFRQADSGLTRTTAGTGLGLSIVKELAVLLGGDVSVESKLGRGSTFTVRLPLHLAEEQQYLVPLRPSVDLSRAKRVTT